MDYEVMDNFPIKTYLEPATYKAGKEDKVFEGFLIISSYAAGNVTELNFLEGRESIVASEFRGMGDDMPEDWDPPVTWSSSDDSVVKVEEGANDTVTVKALKKGKAFITADAGEYGSRTISVTVKKPRLTFLRLARAKYVYTGKALKPKAAGLEDETTSEAVQHTYVEGVDYTMSYKNNVNAGTATATAKGIGDYEGSVSAEFTIAKAKNTLKAKGKKASVSYAGLKKKAKTIKRTKVIAISKAKGKITYKKKSGNKKITISKKGKVTVKKGLKKGIYKVKVRVKASGGKNYKAAAATVTFRIRVR